jgi:hypothetical protein
VAPSANGHDETFILRKHKYERGFTIVDNQLLQNVQELSLRAIGTGAYLWSQPEGAPINARLIAEKVKEGRDAVRAALNELAAAGYIKRDRVRLQAGRFVTHVTLCDRPVFKTAGHTEDGFPGAGQPGAGQPGPQTVKDYPTTGVSSLSGDPLVQGGRTAITDGMRRLCSLMADHAEEMTGKRPDYGERWLTACRLLVTRDGLGEDGVEYLIRWVMASGFWSPNILSMTKLREKRDLLIARIRAERRPNGSPRFQQRRTAANGGTVLTDDDWQQLYQRALEEEAGDGEVRVDQAGPEVQRALPAPADSGNHP